jgi:hypothetical protein
MGMAASQARLLCITARIHDVEQQAQSIQHAKLNLATLSDRAYEEYNAALESTTLTLSAIDVKSGEKSLIPANFNNLCSRNRVVASNGENYAIRNKEGRLLVEDDIEEAYYEFRESGLNDAYQFALYMMNGQNVQDIAVLENGDFQKELNSAEETIYQNLGSVENDKLRALHQKLEELTNTDEAETSIYDENVVPNDKKEDYRNTLLAYRKELYRQYAQQIDVQLHNENGVFDESNPVEQDYDMNLFNYYVSIYNQIQLCGGCVSVRDYNGMNGDAANDTDWLQSMVQSGQFSIEIIDTDSKTGKVSFESTSPSSDSCLAYTTTTLIDKRALAKAEAKYEHTLKDIDKKDQKFDLDLSKLETERGALTKEYESVKKVIEENIERTFGIFS